MAEEGAENGGGKKKLPIKVLAIVAALMVVEGAGVFAFISMMGRGPQDADAAKLEGQIEAGRNAPVEIMLVDDRYQNHSTGRVWLWETQVYVKVKKKNETFVQEILDQRKAEISTGVAQIIRSAQQGHLKEPHLETIGREITAFVNKTFGTDPDGENRVDRVLIPKCRGIPT